MATNSPNSSNASEKQNASPEEKIAILQNNIKYESKAKVVAALICIVFPVIMLSLNYLGFVYFKFWVNILLWSMLILGGLLMIGVNVTLNKYQNEIISLETKRLAILQDKFQEKSKSAELSTIVVESLQAFKNQENIIQNLIAQSSGIYVITGGFIVLPSLVAVLLAYSGPTNLLLFSISGLSALLAVLALVNYYYHQKKLQGELALLKEKSQILNRLTHFYLLYEMSSDEKDKELMIQKMVNDFLYDL